MIQDLASSLVEEIAYRFNHMKDCAIHRALMKAEGGIPAPDTLKAFGMFYLVQQGTDNYEEFKWRGAPMFQIRVRFQDCKATVEVKDL